ncbi:MAG TPA: hypothetical protein DEQ34_08110, partial [Balneolaceae bacterium]|nr:hypothetical protein [Balneolaceae bacterium]
MNKATKVFMSVFVLTLALVSSSFAQNTLFFSQYNEGGSNNKALEIYNPTADTVWLSGYAFPNVSNDPTTPGEFEYWNDFPDSAYILPGDVYVIVHPDADSVMKAAGDYEFTYLSNGDDGFYLVEGDSAAGSSFTVIDKIGTWDADPGSGWDVAGVTNATADHTLYRKPTVMTGNTDWAASAGTDAVSSEWIVAGKDVFTGLGDHSVDKTTTIDEITENVVNAWNFDDMSLGVWSVDTNPDYGVGGTVEVAADIAASGDYSARVMAVDTLEKVGIITFDIDGLGIQEGDTMYFRVWVSAADLAKFDALQPFTQSGNDWSQWSDAYYESSSLTADTWTWLKVGIPAPKDGKFQKAGLQVTGSAATVAETPVVYVDDITVVRPGGVQPDPVNVTFTVNTSTIPDTVNADNYSLYINGAIKGAGAGQSFVGGETITWDANATATLDNVGGDYWTATYQMMPGDTLLYKYRYLNAVTEASDDENGFATDVNPAGWDTRGIVVTSDTVLNVDYFNDSSDSPAPADLVPFESKEDSVTVMFRVNVGGQVQVGSFDPETDQVGLRGNPEFFNNPSD